MIDKIEDKSDSREAGVRHCLPDGCIEYARPQCLADRADAWLPALQRETDWDQPQVRVFGKSHPVPRLTVYYGDRAYRYSGKTHGATPWTPVLKEIRDRVQQLCQQSFNSVLLNCYRNGGDSMGWHADDEKSLGPAPVIASVSLGATRVLRFKHRYEPALRFELPLESGSLFIMHAGMQQYWHHAVPRQAGIDSPRISLTFRQIF